MALVLKDRVWESSTSTGTGNFVLGGTKTGYRTFSSVLANGDTCFYTIVADNGLWETGLGTYNSGTNSLTRTTRYDNSSGTTAAIDFAAGAKEVFLSLPASRFVEKLSSSANLQDLTNASSARSNLGLGTAAVANIVDGAPGSAANGVLQAFPNSLDLGRSGSGDRGTYIDFVSSGDPGTVDSSARIIRNSGENGSFTITNLGTGNLALSNPNGNILALSAASKTDTTSGRIIAVGDFGLGLPTSVAANSEDTTTTGFYKSEIGNTNVPVTANGGQCIVSNWGNSNHVNQLWFDHNANPNNLAYHRIMWKIKREGVWATNPVELLHSENGVYKSEVATNINDLSLTKIALVNTAGRIVPIQAITSGTDLNTITTVGDYSWGNAGTPINAPLASTAGRLEVRLTTGSSTYYSQTFCRYNQGGEIWIRTTQDAGNIWTAWSRLAKANESTTGNAATATALQNARTINGTSFNGTANITTSSWGTARNLQVDLAKNSVTSVNGSANVTNIGVQGALPIANGGTGSTTASAARTALGLGAAAVAGVYTGGAAPSSSDVMAASPGNIELNYNGSGDRTTYMDFHSRNSTDYDARIIKYTGASGTFDLVTTDGSTINTIKLLPSEQTIDFNYASAAGTRIVRFPPAGGGTAGEVRVLHNGTPVGIGYLTCYYNSSLAGSITVATTSSVSFNTTSDYRLKEQVLPMEGALDRIMAANPVTYKWKSDGSAGEGFLAHELAEVVPLAVTGEKDAIDEDGKPKHQQVDYAKLTPVLLAGIQELVAEINTLKQRIEVLESND